MLAGVFGGCLFPFLAIIGRKIGATDLQVALIVSSPYVANAFALLWTEDILGKGRVWYVVWPAAAGRALLLAMFFVATPFWYTLLIYIYMIVTAVPFPSYASIMKTNYPDESRGRLMSYVRVGNAVIWIGASALAGAVLDADTWNFRYVFPFAAVFGVLSALQFGAVKVRGEKPGRERLTGIDHLTAPLRDRAFLRFILAYTLFELGVLIALPVYPLVLVDELNISNAAAGVYGSVYSGFWLLGFFLWGFTLDRLLIRKTMLIFFGAAALIPLIYFASRDIVILGAAQALAGLVFAASDLIGYVLITRLASPQDVPRYTAAHIALGALRGLIAPLAGTYIAGAMGAKTVFFAAFLLSISAAIYALKNMDGRGTVDARGPRYL